MGAVAGSPLPAGGARMAVPLSHGERAQWPAAAIPTQTLEAAAQDWYEFRDNSFHVKLWRKSQMISVALVIVFFASIFLSPAGPMRGAAPVDGQEETTSKELCAMVLAAASGLLLVTFSCYVRWGLLTKLKDEVRERLATPLSRALASSGWTVEAECLARGKHTPAPQGLDRDCMTSGWIWLDFKPSVQVGAPPPATAYQGYGGTSDQTPMMASQGNY